MTWTSFIVFLDLNEKAGYCSNRFIVHLDADSDVNMCKQAFDKSSEHGIVKAKQETNVRL